MIKYLLLLTSLFSFSVNAADFRQMIVAQCANDSTLAFRIQQLRQQTKTNHDAYNLMIRKTASTEDKYQKQLDVGRIVYSWPKDTPVRDIYGKYLRSCLKDVREHLEGINK